MSDFFDMVLFIFLTFVILALGILIGIVSQGTSTINPPQFESCVKVCDKQEGLSYIRIFGFEDYNTCICKNGLKLQVDKEVLK